MGEGERLQFGRRAQMSNPRASTDSARPAAGRAFDWDLVFLTRLNRPLMLLARAMLAYVFIVDGGGAIIDYSGTVRYMQANGVDARLLPLVILTELGAGLMVLLGLKTRWAAVALCGFCLLTALLIHWRANEMIEVQKNVAMAGGFLTLAVFGPGHWSLDGRRGRDA
jgi:putative oxidoreductase